MEESIRFLKEVDHSEIIVNAAVYDSSHKQNGDREAIYAGIFLFYFVIIIIRSLYGLRATQNRGCSK